MKLRHILINVLPLPMWVGYYWFTLEPSKWPFLLPGEELFLAIAAIVFIVYNCYSTKVHEALIRNSLFVLSYASACYISGQLFLKHCYHMSDEHEAVPGIAVDFAIYAAVVVLISLLVKCIIVSIKSKKKTDVA